jgi:gamma-glutamyltranspeptidase / glutathione hydrolase / leukotriene-C4 hydrolase
LVHSPLQLVVMSVVWVPGAGSDHPSAPSSLQPLVAAHGAVASDHEVCSQMGVDVLQAGGSAADAAVTIALCLGVQNPQSSGIGGGAVALHRRARDGAATVYNFREHAPAAANSTMYVGQEVYSTLGPLAGAIPGELKGLEAMWRAHGRLPWAQLISPVAELARDFEVGQALANALADKRAYILAERGLRSVFAPNDTVLTYKDRCQWSSLADTLELIAKNGTDVFYSGSVGQKVGCDGGGGGAGGGRGGDVAPVWLSLVCVYLDSWSYPRVFCKLSQVCMWS